MKKTLVIAGSVHEFESFLREKDRNRQDYIYVHSIDQIRGIRGETIVFYGSYHLVSKALLDEANLRIQLGDLIWKDWKTI